jgi:hypothetical protein
LIGISAGFKLSNLLFHKEILLLLLLLLSLMWCGVIKEDIDYYCCSRAAARLLPSLLADED